MKRAPWLIEGLKQQFLRLGPVFKANFCDLRPAFGGQSKLISVYGTEMERKGKETTSKNKDETSANDAIEKPMLYGPYVTRNSFTCSPIAALLRCCEPINFFTSHSFSLFPGNEEISLDLRGKFRQRKKERQGERMGERERGR